MRGGIIVRSEAERAKAPRRVHAEPGPPSEGDPGPYRIHAVAKITGVPEPTLRAWERRYGLPTPLRTAAGYRLYGAREVEQVHSMRRLCDGGMAAAEAARAIKAESVGDRPAARERLDPYVATVEALLAAVERFDDTGFDREARRAMFLGSSGAVVDRVLVPVLERIGAMWHAGELSVGQEHFASHRLGTVMRDLVRLSIPDDSEDRAIVACFADEEHDVGALSVAMRLASWGARPLFLGARTPPGAIRTAVKATSPKLVALSVTLAPAPARARELVEDYANACSGVPWMVGGAGSGAIVDLVRKHGGIVAPPDVVSLRAEVRRALHADPFGKRQTRARRAK